MSADNPLLHDAPLPDFSSLRPEHVAPAIATLLEEARATLHTLAQSPAPLSWDALITPLDEVHERLSWAWGLVSHLHAVADTPDWRAAYNAALPLVTEYWTALGQNLSLYTHTQALAADPALCPRDDARRAVLAHSLRDFKLGGAELDPAAKARFAELHARAAHCSARFSENLLDATDQFRLHVAHANELAGLPEDALQAARALAEQEGQTGYLFTLHFPSYFPLLQYCENRALREAIYHAHVTRASELGARPEWDNTAWMNELLQLRAQEAQLLGYTHYAAVSLVPKMAQSLEQVEHFLLDLADRARPFAEADWQALQRFASQTCGLDTLHAWDIPFVSERLRQQRYAFSEQEVRQYFQLPRVLDGMFNLAQRLFDVRIFAEPAAPPAWHTDVTRYRIERHGQCLGQFYLDLYAREGKNGGAWMDGLRSRRRTAGDVLHTPLAVLVANFTPPRAEHGTPALLTHDEVMTLFHEFGHGLHHLLTQIDELGVSGIAGVEWDAVELPSQFMENFCWEWGVLAGLSAHVETGAALPRVLFDKMYAARNFQAGLATLRQVEFALFDLYLHRGDSLLPGADIAQVLAAVRARVAVLEPPPFQRFAHSFSHIFSGGYAAGYYSYKWAEVLSADAYAAFEEAGAAQHDPVVPEVGRAFARHILEVGGARPALASFRAFRGRDPDITALLRHQGMLNPTEIRA